MSAAIPRRSIHVDGLKRTLGRVSTWLLLGALPVVIVFAPLIVGFHNGTGAWALDFNGNFVTPARDILRGLSPYHTAYLEHVRAAVSAGHRPDEFSKGVFATDVMVNFRTRTELGLPSAVLVGSSTTPS